MRRALTIAVKLLASLLLATVLCTLGWEGITTQLYDCTDAAGFGCWHPGDWVHRDAAVVQQVVHHRPMTEPDTIKAGWSTGRLWRLWYLLVSVSIGLSAVSALVPWNPRRWPRRVEPDP